MAWMAASLHWRLTPPLSVGIYPLRVVRCWNLKCPTAQGLGGKIQVYSSLSGFKSCVNLNVILFYVISFASMLCWAFSRTRAPKLGCNFSFSCLMGGWWLQIRFISFTAAPNFLPVAISSVIRKYSLIVLVTGFWWVGGGGSGARLRRIFRQCKNYLTESMAPRINQHLV